MYSPSHTYLQSIQVADIWCKKEKPLPYNIKAQQIVSHAMYNANRRDFADCPSGMAVELTDLIEWMTDSTEDQRPVASTICKEYVFPLGTIKLIKQYFGLRY